MHRVRLLRARLPEPRPDHDAAPADRAAAGDGAPAARARRCCGRCSSSTGTTRSTTCAADGTCQLACPVGIDTGALVKELRQQRGTAERAEALARARAPRRWGAVEARLARRCWRGRRRRWRGRTGRGPGRCRRRRPRSLPRDARREGAAAVYFPSCTNRIFGQPGQAGEPSLPEALVAVSRAGRPAAVDPGRRGGQLLRTPWSSKGYRDGPPHKANEMVESALALEREGELPVVVDAGSCTHGIADPGEGVLTEANAERLAGLRGPRLGRLGARPPAAGLARSAARSASAASTRPARPAAWASPALLGDRRRRLAEEVYVPPSATCCGFAGDRGISHPELTEAATRDQADRAGRPPLRRLPLQQPHLRDRPQPRHRRRVRVLPPPARAPDP